MNIELGGLWNGCINAIVLVTTVATAGLAVMCSAAGVCRQWERLRKRKQINAARIGRLERLRRKRPAASKMILNGN